VSLEHLWAGWRTEYISSVTTDERSDEPEEPTGGDGQASDRSDKAGDGACVFDRIFASGLGDEETHIVWRDPGGLVAALLNAYPYATGHLMVMPIRHAGDLETLTPDESAALWAGVSAAVGASKRAFRPEGLNVGINLGRAAGAGVPGHLHVHVVPRWVGDSNFMTSVAETRVLPEALSVSAAKLRVAWPQ
jgi:ATP adenylyltransferase